MTAAEAAAGYRKQAENIIKFVNGQLAFLDILERDYAKCSIPEFAADHLIGHSFGKDLDAVGGYWGRAKAYGQLWAEAHDTTVLELTQ